MHAVREIHVSDTGGTEHDPCAAGRCPVGVGAGVSRAAVGLCLDDAAAYETTAYAVDQIASEQFTCNDAYGSFVERTWEW